MMEITGKDKKVILLRSKKIKIFTKNLDIILAI